MNFVTCNKLLTLFSYWLSFKTLVGQNVTRGGDKYSREYRGGGGGSGPGGGPGGPRG
jgi:hypothetical protein